MYAILVWVFVSLSFPFVLFAETRIPVNSNEITLSFAPVVKRAAPAVVNIYAKRLVNQNRSPFQNDPFFRRFFQNRINPQKRVQNSLGSGVILSEDGYVVSNYHVVGNASDIRVVLNDRRQFTASVALADEKNDLAILILENAESMPFLALREDEAVAVGELVLAIGNPFGVGQTVTSGIISGLARSGTADGSGRGYYLQTDAAINPGNSGGALVDINGSLVGINTSILTRSGGSNGIGFAIPAAFVREFLRQAKSGVKKFEQPWLGVFGQAITPELAEALQLDGFDGMVISALHEKSPLMLAGLSKGDVVVSVDNFAVNGPAEMLYRLTVAGIGSQSKLTIVSGGQRRDLWIKLKPAPNDPPSNLKRLPKTSPLRDLIVRIINPAVQQEMGLGLSTRGIVVVEPGPIGSRLGFRSGDIIEEINGNRLNSAEQIDELIGTSNRSGQFIISRDGQRLTIRYRT